MLLGAGLRYKPLAAADGMTGLKILPVRGAADLVKKVRSMILGS